MSKVGMKSTTMGFNLLLLPIILIKSMNTLTCLKYEKGLSDQQVTEICEDKNLETKLMVLILIFWANNYKWI